ncbi:MAG: hypothetical protein ACM3XP_00655 [Nitrososphaerales archaeon]
MDIPSIIDLVADEKIITLDNYYIGFNVNSNLKYASSNQYFLQLYFVISLFSTKFKILIMMDNLEILIIIRYLIPVSQHTVPNTINQLL